MEIFINALIKVAEYLLDFKSKKDDPHKKLCHNLAKLYLLYADFSNALEEVRTTCTQRLTPKLSFTRGSGYDPTNFVGFVGSHLSPSEEFSFDSLSRLSRNYERMDHLRKEIFKFIIDVLPFEKICIFFPQVRRTMLGSILADLVRHPNENETVTEISQWTGTRGILALDNFDEEIMRNSDNLYPFHTRLVNAIQNGEQGWRNYLFELQWGSEQINNTILELRKVLQENCKLEDVL